MTIADKLREARGHLETFKFHSNLTMAAECVEKALAALPEPDEVELWEMFTKPTIMRKQRDDLAAALIGLDQLKATDVRCFCEVKMFLDDEHDAECLAARAALKRVEDGK